MHAANRTPNGSAAIRAATATFLDRDLATPDGVFASSLSADTLGDEGATYVWTYDELESLLSADELALAEARSASRPRATGRRPHDPHPRRRPGARAEAVDALLGKLLDRAAAAPPAGGRHEGAGELERARRPRTARRRERTLTTTGSRTVALALARTLLERSPPTAASCTSSATSGSLTCGSPRTRRRSHLRRLRHTTPRATTSCSSAGRASRRAAETVRRGWRLVHDTGRHRAPAAPAEHDSPTPTGASLAAHSQPSAVASERRRVVSLATPKTRLSASLPSPRGPLSGRARPWRP